MEPMAPPPGAILTASEDVLDDGVPMAPPRGSTAPVGPVLVPSGPMDAPPQQVSI